MENDNTTSDASKAKQRLRTEEFRDGVAGSLSIVVKLATDGLHDGRTLFAVAVTTLK